MADYSDVMTAARALDDPSTSAADLAQIAQLQPGLRANVASHPNVYPGLTDWLAAQGVVRPSPVAPPVQVFPNALPAARPAAPVMQAQPASAFAQPAVAPVKVHLRIPVNSPMPLIAGILFAICAIGVFLSNVMFDDIVAIPWKIARGVMPIISWNFAWELGPRSYFMAWVSFGVVLLVGWASGALLLTTAVLCLLSIRWKSLLKPAVVLAGVSLVAHPLFWYFVLVGWRNMVSSFARNPIGAAVAVLGVAAGVLFVIAATARFGARARNVLKIVLLVFVGLVLVALVLESLLYWIRYFRAGLPLVPFILFLAANTVLIVALSSDPTKAYYGAPARPQPMPLASEESSSLPLYAMATMPDGSKQMIPVGQPTGSAARSNQGNPVGVVALIAGVISVVALVVSQVVSRSVECSISMSSFEISCPGQGVVTALVWVSLLVGIAGLACGAVGISMYRRRNATNLAVSIVGLCLGSIILLIMLLALILLGALI